MKRRNLICLILSTCLVASSSGFDFRRLPLGKPIDMVLSVPVNIARKIGDHKIHLPVAGGVDLSVLKIEDTIKNEENSDLKESSADNNSQQPFGLPQLPLIGDQLPIDQLNPDMITSHAGSLPGSTHLESVYQTIMSGKMPTDQEIAEIVNQNKDKFPLSQDTLTKLSALPNADKLLAQIAANESLMESIKKLQNRVPSDDAASISNSSDVPKTLESIQDNPLNQPTNIESAIPDKIKELQDNIPVNSASAANLQKDVLTEKILNNISETNQSNMSNTDIATSDKIKELQDNIAVNPAAAADLQKDALTEKILNKVEIKELQDNIPTDPSTVAELPKTILTKEILNKVENSQLKESIIDVPDKIEELQDNVSANSETPTDPSKNEMINNLNTDTNQTETIELEEEENFQELNSTDLQPNDEVDVIDVLKGKVAELQDQAPNSKDIMLKKIEESGLISEISGKITDVGTGSETSGSRKKRSFNVDDFRQLSSGTHGVHPSTVVMNYKPILEDVDQDLLIERDVHPKMSHLNEDEDDSWRHYKNLQTNDEKSQKLEEFFNLLRIMGQLIQ